MPDVGRLVEVKGVKEGSGFLIADRLVLTAWHLVQPCPSSDEAPTSTVRVRLERDIKPGTPPEDALRIATRIWPQNPPGEDLDFALLSIQYDPAEPSDIPEEVVPWASLDRWGEIEVEAVGYPDVTIESGLRDTKSIKGRIKLADNLRSLSEGRGALTIRLRDEDAPLGAPQHAWLAMSGAAVFAGSVLIGMIQAAGAEGSRHQLQALPVDRLFAREDVVDAIRAAGYPVPPYRAFSINWDKLREICKSITDEHRLDTWQQEYDKLDTEQQKHDKIYIQRNTVRRHVDVFLKDREKRGFILVGKSGSGKSDFLAALAEELQPRNNVCVLMYHGSQLPIASSTLTKIVADDYNDRSSQVEPVQQVWDEIGRIVDGMGERRVVFCVDAVNENQRASDLLAQLNALVDRRLPWLKVILSSRVETWRIIQSTPGSAVRGFAKRYYLAPKSERRGRESEPFSYSELMESFSSEELRFAYSSYKSRFGVQTDYDSLSPKLQDTIRDPMSLWLLTSGYRNQAIPPTEKTSETLIEKYVDEMSKNPDSKQIDFEMRHFLENDVVPLMVKAGHYSNVITDADLAAAGDATYKMFYNNQLNQEFLKLRDADVLVLEVQENEEGRKERRTKFAHERFYEYFVGNELARLADDRKTHDDRRAFFEELIEETTHKPFFWGAVRNALAKEASKPNSETTLKLCQTTKQRVKEMMVNVLIGLESQEQVDGVLRNLIPQEGQVREWQKIRYLVSKTAEEADPQTLSARKIAIEVASTLKLGPILETAALHTDPTMRAMAVRYSYYLWQHDRDAGFAVLQHLADKATTGVVPNCLGLESIFGLSLIIVCDSYTDLALKERPEPDDKKAVDVDEVLSRLQGIWKGMIAKLFYMREGDSRWKGVVRDFLRERIIRFVIAYVFSLLRELPPNNMMNYDALEAFFRLKPTDKNLYRRLISYFDVNGYYFKAQMEEDYFAVLKIDNALMRLAATMGLIAHAWANSDQFHNFLPFLKQLFEAAKSDVATYPYLRAIYNVPISLLQRGKYSKPKHDAIFDFFFHTAEVCRICYTQHPEKYQFESGGPPPQAPGIGTYINFQYRREGAVKTPWLKRRIQEALEEPNIELFKFFLSSEFPDQAINQHAPEAVLDALELFFKSGNAEITKMIQAFLSRLRLYYPDLVDDFLVEQQDSDKFWAEFCLQVRTNEPSERVGDLIGLRAWYFARDSALLGPPERCAQLMRFFEKAAEYNDTRAWINYVIRHMVNLIYGGEVLRESA